MFYNMTTWWQCSVICSLSRQFFSEDTNVDCSLSSCTFFIKIPFKSFCSVMLCCEKLNLIIKQIRYLTISEFIIHRFLYSMYFVAIIFHVQLQVNIHLLCVFEELILN